MIRLIRSLIAIFTTTGLLVPFFFALAHQLRIVPPTPSTITINNPDVSQAFYGELRNAPDSYSLSTDKPLHLHTSILVPDINHVDKDIFVIATDAQAQSIVFTLNGMTASWSRFYEPFGGNWYLQGPEIELDVPAGTYNITVSSPDNSGKYVLAVGKTELFPPREIINAFIIAPQIKFFYFKESIPSILFSPWGIALIIILVIVALTVFIVIHFSRHYSLRKRFVSFCLMLYYRYIQKVG